jgi:lysophospholipase L1-like esterase
VVAAAPAGVASRPASPVTAPVTTPPPAPPTFVRSSRSSRWSRRRRRIASLLLGIGIAVGLAEIGLRPLSRFLYPPLYELDTELGWVNARDVARDLADETGRVVHFATDAHGHRTAPNTAPPAAPPTGAGARRRVVFTGDSFTQGSQVEVDELFVTLVGRAVPDITTWNAGVGGYSTLQQLRALPAQLGALAPDLVVLVVFENDFVDNLMPYFSGLGPRPYVTVRDGQVTGVATLDPASFERFLMPAPAAFWCYQHLALYRTLHKNLFLPAAGDRLARLELAERAAVPEADQRLAMQWLLTKLAAMVHAANARLLVAAIPLREAAAAGAAPSHAWLAAQCAAAGTPFVSLLPALREPRSYFVRDIHLTAFGHAAVAAALAPAVAESLRRRD